MPSPTQTMIGSQCMHTHTENRKQPLASAVNTFTSTALTVSDNALPASSSPPSTMPSLRCVVMHVSFGCVVMHVSLRCVVLGVCVTRCLARFLRPQPTNPARLAPFVCVCVHAGEHPPDADADADGCRSEGSSWIARPLVSAQVVGLGFTILVNGGQGESLGFSSGLMWMASMASCLLCCSLWVYRPHTACIHTP